MVSWNCSFLWTPNFLIFAIGYVFTPKYVISPDCSFKVSEKISKVTVDGEVNDNADTVSAYSQRLCRHRTCVCTVVKSRNTLTCEFREYLCLYDKVREICLACSEEGCQTRSFTAIRLFSLFIFFSQTMLAWGPKVVVPFYPNKANI